MSDVPSSDNPTPDYNVKHPKLPFLGEYPYLHVTQDAGGGQILKSIFPGSEALFHIHTTGSYEGHGPDGAKVQVTVGKTHEYHGDGKSSTVDGHHDVKVSGTTRSNHDGGMHSEVNGDHYKSGSGHQVHSTNDTQVHHTNADKFEIIEGNHVIYRSGDVHENITGDHMVNILGNKVDVLNGEWGINSQDGNVDVQVDNGTLTANVSSDVMIRSYSSITLQVGKNTIVIDENGITITASAVSFVKAGR